MNKKALILSVSLFSVFGLVLTSFFLRVISVQKSNSSHREVLAATTTTTPLTEKFIPLGTGQTDSNQWTNVPGLQVTLNTSVYPRLKQVFFEVGIFNPNASGSISVQLYNVTGGYPIWGSVVSSDATMATVTSGPITLPTGNNTYQVQMLNTLNAPAILNQARLRMISN